MSLALLAGVLLAGLVAVPGSPAGAQDITDLPRLGFDIDPHAGYVGDVVAAQVDIADVEEHCVVDQAEAFFLFRNPDGSRTALDGGGASLAQFNPGPLFAELMSYGPLVGLEPLDGAVWATRTPAFPPITFQYGPGTVEPQDYVWLMAYNQGVWESSGTPIVWPGGVEPQWRVNHEQLAALLLWVFMDTAGSGSGIATGGPGPNARLAYVEGTKVLTFVDPATQELVGEVSNFDLQTGQGEVVVPEVEPGLWAVAAACVEPDITDESFLAAVNAGAQWLADNDIPVLADPFGDGGTGGGTGYLAGEVAPLMLAELMAPTAIGLDFYCILNQDGFCATPPDPVGLLAELSDEEFAEFADLQAGDGAGDGDAGPDGLAVEPVSASPAFTG